MVRAPRHVLYPAYVYRAAYALEICQVSRLVTGSVPTTLLHDPVFALTDRPVARHELEPRRKGVVELHRYVSGRVIGFDSVLHLGARRFQTTRRNGFDVLGRLAHARFLRRKVFDAGHAK